MRCPRRRKLSTKRFRRAFAQRLGGKMFQLRVSAPFGDDPFPFTVAGLLLEKTCEVHDLAGLVLGQTVHDVNQLLGYGTDGEKRKGIARQRLARCWGHHRRRNGQDPTLYGLPHILVRAQLSALFDARDTDDAHFSYAITVAPPFTRNAPKPNGKETAGRALHLTWNNTIKDWLPGFDFWKFIARREQGRDCYA